MILNRLMERQSKRQRQAAGSWSLLVSFTELGLAISIVFCAIFIVLTMLVGGDFLRWLTVSFALLTFGELVTFGLNHYAYYRTAALALLASLLLSIMVVLIGDGFGSAAPVFLLINLLLTLAATQFVAFSKAALWGQEHLKASELMISVGRLEGQVELLQAALDSLEEGLLLTDLQDKVLRANRHLNTLFGLRSDAKSNQAEGGEQSYATVNDWINQIRAVVSNPDDFRTSMITARSQVRRGETSVFVFGIEKPNPRYRPATEPNISRPQLPESPPAADGGYYSQPEPSLPDPAKEAEINPEPMFERDTRPLLYRELKITVFPIIGFKSNHIGVGYLVRDVTDEREVEQIKENFISIVSHEVRTPMAVILGLTELLALPNVEKSEQEEWVKAINQEALRLRTVLNDMQSMSRIKDGAFELSLEDIELKELVDRVVKVTQLQYRSHHNVTVDLDIPQSIIYSDRGKVTQVLTNLIGNAIKYTPENGEIKINAGTRPNHPNEIYISVTDQGIGIPKSEQHKVFSRFFRSRNTREKGIGGTGLGLAITQHLVKLMGGNVWFESEENRGSTFYFSLPLPQHNNLMLEDSNPEDNSNIGAST